MRAVSALPDGEGHGEGRSPTLFTLTVDGTVMQRYQFMNECQADPCPANVLCAVVAVEETSVEVSHLFFGHTYAVVGDAEGSHAFLDGERQACLSPFPVVFDGYKYTRNEVFEKLAEQGIGARKYFYPLTNSFECYRNYPTAGTEKTPVAQHIALRVLTLPLYADLSLEDVDRICDVILG